MAEPSEKIISIIAEHGKDVLAAANLQREKSFIQHGSISCYEHSLCVAYLSVWLALRLKAPVDMRSLVRGALLHDFFLYDWHEPSPRHRLHGFTHACTALKNASAEFDLNPVERDIISKHMFPLNLRLPACRESFIVCTADKLCTGLEVLRLSARGRARVAALS